MTVSVGSVVKALNGRDKENLLVVLKTDGEYLLLADGKRRRVDSPKRKKAKHVADTNIKADFGNPITNKNIKKTLGRIYSSLESHGSQR